MSDDRSTDRTSALSFNTPPAPKYLLKFVGDETIVFSLYRWPKYRIWRFMQWLVFGFKWEKL